MPLRILVVENHADTRVSLCALLETLGHVVTQAISVGDGLLKIAASDFDVLISDIELGDGTGWDLLASAHLPPGVRAIAFSGFCSSEDLARSKSAGFHHHLVKPRGLEALEKIIESVHKDLQARDRLNGIACWLVSWICAAGPVNLE
jgi:CheY-like chemotaxis protein